MAYILACKLNSYYNYYMLRILKQLSYLLDFIYKKRCYFCRSSRENTKMCKKCYDTIDFLPPYPVMKILNKQVYSASVYAKNLQKLIRGIKYHNQTELAHFQAKIMYDFWQTLPVSEEKFVIVPVPLHKKRLKDRKYNHMALVAEEFAKFTGYTINDNLIHRIKETKPQYRLSIKERESNLKDAFKVDKSSYDGENLLIIDDILTTGSTLKAMIQTFIDADIYNITAFTTSCTESHAVRQETL